jgi:hypothetical protein
MSTEIIIEKDFSKNTREQLLTICKEKGLKGYSGKKKADLVSILQTTAKMKDSLSSSASDIKKNKGQFYTTNSFYILDGFSAPPTDIRCIMEPFAGKGDLIEWIRKLGITSEIEAYDIEPKHECVQKKDTLLSPPDYNNTWIITNPPYLARNKSVEKDVFDLYDTNDLYKCFLLSIVKQNNCRGGIIIIPAGFFFSPRDIDVRCRNAFMKHFKIIKVKYFEESVFHDTTTTVVAFSFEKANEELSHQVVDWIMLPSGVQKTFSMTSLNDWIIGGDIYKLPISENISVRRYVQDQQLRNGEQQTFILLNALDSGTQDGRISLSYKKDFIYPAKECSRTYATFRITGKTLNEKEQVFLCQKFNEFLEEKRKETWSLFLPQYRESKEYARKRIPFELAYRIFLHIIHKHFL